MKPSKDCIDLIKQFEGYRSQAYQCSARVWTIGYGTTRYPDGKPVKKGDVCTHEQAIEWLTAHIERMSVNVLDLMPNDVKQSNFDAVVSLVYNIGLGAFQKSTLLRKMRLNVKDASIYTFTLTEGLPTVGSCEFLKWVRANSVVLKGLQLRRAAEANLYKKDLCHSNPPVKTN